jgi:hypothetical protein
VYKQLLQQAAIGSRPPTTVPQASAEECNQNPSAVYLTVRPNKLQRSSQVAAMDKLWMQTQVSMKALTRHQRASTVGLLLQQAGTFTCSIACHHFMAAFQHTDSSKCSRNQLPPCTTNAVNSTLMLQSVSATDCNTSCPPWLVSQQQ